MEKFGALAENFSCVADFMMVYTLEAHPKENEDFTNSVEINIHQNLEDRMSAAKFMLETESQHFRHVKVVVDSMTNQGMIKDIEFQDPSLFLLIFLLFCFLGCTQYATFPARIFIIQDGIIRHVGGVGPFKMFDSICKAEDILNKIHTQSQDLQ